MRLSPGKIANVHAARIHTAADVVEKVTVIGKELREPMRSLAGTFYARHVCPSRCGASPCRCGDSADWTEQRARIEDCALAIPRAPATQRGSELSDSAAPDVHRLQPAVCKETNRGAVGRPERARCEIGPLQGPCRRGIQRTQPQPRAAFVCRDEHDLVSIWRDRKRDR